MPEWVTQKYHFGGWQTVLTYNEAEMAEALGMSQREFRRMMDTPGGEASKANLAYHAHPSSNALREYQFLAGTYTDNIAKWQCYQVRGGHVYVLDHYYDEERGKGAYKCQFCPAEKYD